MSLKITHKHSTAAGTPPASGDIDVGEIAINTADAELYTKDNDGNIRKFQNTTTGTADGVNFTQAGTGAVQRTVESKLQDVVSVKDFGAVGDGVTDDTAAIQAAIDAVNLSGGGIVSLPGIYLTTAPINLKSYVLIRGNGEIVADHNLPAIRALGSRVNQGNLLAANGVKGVSSLTLATGKGANFSAGDWAIIYRTSTYQNLNPLIVNGQKVGQIISIKSVSGDVLTLDTVLQYDFPVSDASEVERFDLVYNPGIEGITVKPKTPASYTSALLQFLCCYRPKIVDVTLKEAFGRGSQFYGCIGHEVIRLKTLDLASSDTAPYLGYGVEEAGANLGGVIEVHSERVRHAYTTNASATVMPFGEPVGTVVTGSALDSRAAAWDTHEIGSDVTFKDCKVIGGGRAGFQIRNRNSAISGGSVTGTTGAGVYVVGINSYRAENIRVDGLICVNTNLGTDDNGVNWKELGAVYDQGRNTVVSNLTVRDCSGPGVMADGSYLSDPEYRSIIIDNPCLSPGTAKFAIGYLGALATSIKISDVTVRCPSGNMDYGVYVASTNVDAIVLGCRVKDAAIAPLLLNNSHFSILNPSQGTTLNLGVRTVVNVSSGAVTLPPSSRGTGIIVVTGEGAAPDDLDTINGTGSTDGALITIQRASSTTITVKHATGNLLLSGGADVVLSSDLKSITFRKQGSNWVEFCRSL